ncbi:hypothetical protein [Litchfieldella rifensis]|uniref:Uncharacterized protein n=1 Tax=Litchfieldella rifensis TaxID=762643 RepID=A0ABV7LQ64_9GAMM
MPYRINTAFKGANPTLQICDASSGSVRLAWEYPRQDPQLAEEDHELLEMKREEAIHELFRRLFLLTTEQYLKGEIGEPTAGTRASRHR